MLLCGLFPPPEGKFMRAEIFVFFSRRMVDSTLSVNTCGRNGHVDELTSVNSLTLSVGVGAQCH